MVGIVFLLFVGSSVGSGRLFSSSKRARNAWVPRMGSDAALALLLLDLVANFETGASCGWLVFDFVMGASCSGGPGGWLVFGGGPGGGLNFGTFGIGASIGFGGEWVGFFGGVIGASVLVVGAIACSEEDSELDESSFLTCCSSAPCCCPSSVEKRMR